MSVQTTIGKSLVVAVTVISLASLGFAAVALATHRDWETDISELEQELIERAGTEQEQTQRRQLAGAGAMVQDRVAGRLGVLDAQLDRLLGQSVLTQQANEVDPQALEAAIAEFDALLAELRAEIETLRAELADIAEQAVGVTQLVTERREELARLESLYHLMVAQRGAAERQFRIALNELYQEQGSLTTLRDRNEQLQQRAQDLQSR